MDLNDRYSCRVTWSPEDKEDVGLCAEFPGLSWLARDHASARGGIMQLVADVVQDLRKNHEPIPEPIAAQKFSGKFLVRIPPDLHRRLALDAAEAGVSLNRYVSDKLRQ